MADLSYKYVINTELKLNTAELDAKLENVKKILENIDIKPKSVATIKKNLDSLSKTVDEIMGKEVTLLPKDEKPYTQALSFLSQIAGSVDKVMTSVLTLNQELATTVLKYKEATAALRELQQEKNRRKIFHAKEMGVPDAEKVVEEARQFNFRTDPATKDLEKWRFKSLATAETAMTKATNAAAPKEVLDGIQAEIDKMKELLPMKERLGAAEDLLEKFRLKAAAAIEDLLPKEQQLEETKAKLAAQVEKESGALENVVDAHKELKPTMDATNTSLQESNRSLEKNQQELDKTAEMQDKLTNKLKYFLTVTLAALAMRQLRNFMRDAISHVRELDKALTSIATVSGNTREQMWKLSVEFNRMARELGRTTVEVASASEIFYRQGKTTAEVMALTRASLISASIAGITTTEASNRLTAALNGFTLEASEAMNVADKFAALAAKSASSFNELSSALSKTASSAYTAGLDMDYMLGFLAKTIEATREAPENLGTAFKTIIARMQQIREVGFAQDEDGTDFIDVNKVETALNSIGVLLRDKVTKQFRPLQEVFDDMGEKWEDLDRNTKAYLATILSGSRQQSRFLALMNNYDRTLQLVGVAQNSAGEASKQFTTYLTGLEAATNKLRAAKEQLMQKMMPPELQESVLKFFSGWLETISRMSTPMIYLTAVIIAATIAIAAKTITTMHAISVDKEALGVTLLQKIARKLDTAETWKAVTAQLALNAAKQIYSAIVSSTIITTLGIVAAVGALIYVLTLLFTRQKKLSEQRRKTINENEAQIISLNREINSIESLAEEYEALNAKLIKTAEEKKRLVQISQELQNNYPHLIAYIDSEGIAHMNTALAIEEANSKKREALKLEKEALAKRKAEVAYRSRGLADSKRVGFGTQIDEEGVVTGDSFTYIKPLSTEEKQQIESDAREARAIAVKQLVLNTDGFGATEENLLMSIASNMIPTDNDIAEFQKELDIVLGKAVRDGVIKELDQAGKNYRSVMSQTLTNLTSLDTSVMPDMASFSQHISEYINMLQSAGMADATIDRMLKTGDQTLDYIVSVHLALSQVGEELNNISRLNTSAFATLAQNLEGKNLAERNKSLKDFDKLIGQLDSSSLENLNRASDKLDTSSKTAVYNFNNSLKLLIEKLATNMSETDKDSLYNFLKGDYDKTKTVEEIVQDSMRGIQEFFKQQEKLAEVYNMVNEEQEFSLQQMAETLLMFPELAKYVDIINGKITIQKAGVEALWQAEKLRHKGILRDKIDELNINVKLLKSNRDLIETQHNFLKAAVWIAPEQVRMMDQMYGDMIGIDKKIADQLDTINAMEKIYQQFDLITPSGVTVPSVEPYIMNYTELERLLLRIAFLQDEINAVQDLRPFLQAHEQKIALLAIEEEQLSILSKEQENLMKLYDTQRNQAASELVGKYSQYIKFDEWGFVQLTDKINSAGNATKEAIDDLIDKYNENTQGLRDTERALVENSKAVMEAARTRMEITFDEELRKLEELLFGTTQQKAQDAFELEEANMKKWLSYEEKTLEISKIRGSLEKSLREAITSGQESMIANEIKMLDVMESQDKLSRMDLERMQKAFAIKELEMRLENLRNQKTIQTLRRMADGTWQFQYEVDVEAIEDTQEKLRDAKLEQIKFEKDAEFNARKEEFDNKVKFLDRIREVTQRALAGEFADHQAFLDELGYVHELFSNKVYLGDSSIWATVKTFWNTTTTEMASAYEGFITALNTYTTTAILSIQTLNDRMAELLKTLKQASGISIDPVKTPTSTLQPTIGPTSPTAPTNTGGGGNVAPKTEPIVSAPTADPKYAFLPLLRDLYPNVKYNSADNSISIEGVKISLDNTSQMTGAGLVVNGGTTYVFDPALLYDYIKRQMERLAAIKTTAGGDLTYTGTTVLPYSQGGVIDYTGPAMVHGSRTNPEVVFNAEDASKLYNIVRSLPNVAMFGEMFKRTISAPAVPSTSTTQQQVYNIDKLEFPNVRDSEQIKKAIESLPRYVLQQTRTVTS